MRVQYCPLDFRLTFLDANKLLRHLQPSHLIVSSNYAPSASTTSNPRNNITVSEYPAYSLFEPLTAISFTESEREVHGVIHPDLAKSLESGTVQYGASTVCSVVGAIEGLSKGDAFSLHLPTERERKGVTDNDRDLLWGTVDVHR